MRDSTYEGIVRLAVQLTFAVGVTVWGLFQAHLTGRLRLRWKRARRLLRRALADLGSPAGKSERFVMVMWLTVAATIGGFTRKAAIGELSDEVAMAYSLQGDPLVPPRRRAGRAGRTAIPRAILNKCTEEPYRVLHVSLKAAGFCFGFVTAVYAAGLVLAMTFPDGGVEVGVLGLATFGNLCATVFALATAALFRGRRSRAGRLGMAAMGAAALATAVIHSGWPALPGPWQVAVWASLATAGVAGLTWSVLASTEHTWACCRAAGVTGAALCVVAALTVADGVFGYAAGSEGNIFNLVGAAGWFAMGQGALVVSRLGGIAQGVGARDVQQPAS